MREFIWPSMGWKRTASYIKHRLVRLPDSSRSIAIGLAAGTAASFSPLIGTHIIQAAILAFLLRGNLIASVIGTIAGNPWTFPFIWMGSFWLGNYILNIFGWNNDSALPEHIDFFSMIEIAKTNPMDVFLPWMVGGYILCFAILFPSYYLYAYLIKGARLTRDKMIAQHKQKKEKK